MIVILLVIMIWEVFEKLLVLMYGMCLMVLLFGRVMRVLVVRVLSKVSILKLFFVR